MVGLLIRAAVASAEEGAPADEKGGPPDDAPFSVAAPANAESVRLLLEVWGDSAHAELTRGIAEVAVARGVPVAVLVPLGDLPAELLAWASTAPGVEIGVVVVDVPQDPADGPGAVRRQLAGLPKRVSKPRIVASRLPTRTTEAILGKAGFRTILVLDGPRHGTPRRAAVFEGQPSVGVVVPPGPYMEDLDAVPPEWTVASADHAAQALHGAASTGKLSAVRVGVDARAGDPNDAALLARWLDEVVLPGGVPVVSHADFRAQTMVLFRTGEPADYDPAMASPGRLVSLADVERGARELEAVEIVPRALPGDLNPTSAWLAFVQVLGDRTEGGLVRIGDLGGPVVDAASGLAGPVQVPAEEVRAVARQLLAVMPDEIPSSLPVGNELLTAGESLLLFASAVRGDDPAVTRPVRVVDPNAPGLGWGASTAPR